MNLYKLLFIFCLPLALFGCGAGMDFTVKLPFVGEVARIPIYEPEPPKSPTPAVLRNADNVKCQKSLQHNTALILRAEGVDSEVANIGYMMNKVSLHKRNGFDITDNIKDNKYYFMFTNEGETCLLNLYKPHNFEIINSKELPSCQCSN